MGTIANATAHFGLAGSGEPEGLQRGGSVSLGRARTQQGFPNADIFYSCSIESTAAFGEAILNIGSGMWGSDADVTIEGATGKDFEGETLPTLATLYAILIERVSDNPLNDAILITPQEGNLPTLSIDETTRGIYSHIFPEGIPIAAASDEIAFLFNGNGDKVILTIVGQS